MSKNPNDKCDDRLLTDVEARAFLREIERLELEELEELRLWAAASSEQIIDLIRENMRLEERIAELERELENSSG